MNDTSTFWTRRIAAVQAEADTDSQIELARQERAEVEALEEKDDTEILAELGLPDPVTMQQGDDFVPFMSKAVPEHLRRKALRTLWRSNPVLACVDGLNDYDEDFTKIGVLTEPLKTAYQVGKGMTAHIREIERLALRGTEDGSEDGSEISPGASSEKAEPLDSAPDTDQQAIEARLSEADIQEPDMPQEEADLSPVPRRMRFHFQEATT